MLNRIMLIAITVTFLTAVIPFNTYSQRRQRSSGRPNRQASASPVTREAEQENQKFWQTLYVKCGDSYFGEVAPGLSQMRMVTFSVSPRQLTDVDKENGYEWRGSGVMRFGRRRMLTFGKWSDWVSAEQDWMAGGKLTAVLQKKHGHWSAVYSPFDGIIISKRPTCEGLSQFGIETPGPAIPQLAKWQRARVSLSAPKQISPANGTVFNHFPRHTKLQWEPVPGASSYSVEIQVYIDGKFDDSRPEYFTSRPPTSGIRDTFYDYEHVGAQPGRWRVWAVDSNGKTGRVSEWWVFRYSQ